MKIDALFRRIAKKLNRSPCAKNSPDEKKAVENTKNKTISFTFSHNKEKILPSFISEARQSAIINKSFTKKIMDPPLPLPSRAPMEPVDPQDENWGENMKALKRLRALPRGTQVESRIAAIQNLLGENEVFQTLQMLRWPQGIVCPRCHSGHIVRREPPPDAIDQRHYYVCLNCKGDGDPSEFDDFTGLPIGSLHGLRRWILCWYLIGFCSVHQIAKVLGVSIQSVFQMATIGSELTALADPEVDKKFKKEAAAKEEKTQSQKRKRTIEEQEEHTRSASKSPLKPGYKAKK